MSASQQHTPASVPALPTDMLVGVTLAQLRAALDVEGKEAAIRALRTEVESLQLLVRRMIWALLLGLLFAGGNLVAIWQLPQKVENLERRLGTLETQLSTQR